MSTDLCKGFALVVDDQLDKGSDEINEIVSSIRKNDIPVVAFNNLNEASKVLSNLLTINFVILDWQMFETMELLEGVNVGEEARQIQEDEIFDFIRKIKSVCFAPIFIFTNEDDTTIISKLEEKGFYFKEGRNFIFVKNKTKLTGAHLFAEIDTWLNSNPSIYVLKKWEKSFFKAKNEVFWGLYNKSNGLWPKILWKNFKDEGEDAQTGINETIFSLIIAESELGGLDEEKIMISEIPEAKETKELFRRLMYQEEELHGIKPGDIFKDGDKYYLNIRPECDTAPGRENSDYVYLIEGSKLTADLAKKCHSRKTGFIEKIGVSLVFMLDGHDIVSFEFKKLEIKECNPTFKEKRICRLLPPYITSIQQRYSTFLGRIGIPRLPVEIEKEILAITATAETITPSAATGKAKSGS